MNFPFLLQHFQKLSAAAVSNALASGKGSTRMTYIYILPEVRQNNHNNSNENQQYRALCIKYSEERNKANYSEHIQHYVRYLYGIRKYNVNCTTASVTVLLQTLTGLLYITVSHADDF